MDINIASIQHAVAQTNIVGLSQVHFLAADATELPFRAASFNVVFLKAVLTVVFPGSARMQILRQLRSVLCVGGEIIIVEFCRTWSIGKYRSRYAKGMTETGEVGSFRACDPATGELRYLAHHFSHRELTLMMTEAGFRISRTEKAIRGFRTSTGNYIDGLVIVGAAI